MKKSLVSLLGLVAIVIIVAIAFLTEPRFASHAASTNTSFNNGYPQLNLTYQGGPVMAGTTNVYAIFWEPTGNVSANYNTLIERFLGDFGNSSLYKIASQYTQTGGGSPTNAVLAGTWVDSTAYVRSSLWDSDIQNSVTRAQQANGWISSLNNLFIVFTERSETLCTPGSPCPSPCGYQSHFGTDTIYSAVPYVANSSCNYGLGPNHDDADSTINALSLIEMDAVTNPLGNAWYRSSNGLEIEINWNADRIEQNGGREVNIGVQPATRLELCQR